MNKARKSTRARYACAGLWHGAGFTFVIWGLAHGAWLLLERKLNGRVRLPRLVRVLLVFHGVWLDFIYFTF